VSASIHTITSPSAASEPLRTAWLRPQPPGAEVIRRVFSGTISGSRIGGVLPSSTTITSVRCAG